MKNSHIFGVLAQFWRRFFLLVAASFCLLSGLSSVTFADDGNQHLSERESCAVNKPKGFQSCWYAGAGIGWSNANVQLNNLNDYRVAQDEGLTADIYVGNYFQPNWLFELSYNPLHEATVHSIAQPNTELPGISTHIWSGHFGYFLRKQDKTFRPYAKLGLSYINTNKEGSGAFDYKRTNPVKTSGSLGAYYTLGSRWFLRGEADFFVHEKSAFTLGLGKHLGSHLVDIAPVIVAITPPPAIDEEAEDVEEVVAPSPKPPVEETLTLAPTLEFVADATTEMRPEPEDGIAIQACKMVRVATVYFVTASQYLDLIAKGVLDKIAYEQAMTMNPLSVYGHTDSQGTTINNAALAERRARTVMDYLSHQGIIPSRIQWQAFGESEPVDSNATPEGRKNNRRVDIYEHVNCQNVL